MAAPVDPATQAAMEGAMQKHRGFARMWSAGAGPGVQAAYQQSAATQGMMAAQNIRQRYFQKEWEQIRDTRLKPLQDRLKSAQARREAMLQTTVMPVTRVVSAEEAQGISERLQPQPPQITTVPGKPTKEGAQGSEAITMPPAPAPNPALSSPQLNATVAEEQLAVVDPASGMPVPISSARGVSVLQQAESEFWGEYTNVNREMMDVLGEYSGNPYADRMAERLIDFTTRQANVATTGQGDAQAAQEWMENRQEWEAQQELRGQTVKTGAFALETQEAGLDVTARDAERLAATDASFRDLLGDKITSKLEQGQELTRREKFEASSAVRTHRGLQEKQIAQRAKQRVFTIPAINVTNPENWQADMMTGDAAYQTYYGQELAQLSNAAVGELQEMPQDQMVSILRQYGASDAEVERAVNGLWNDPNVARVVEAYVNSTGAAREANDRAYLRRLPELERQQPELTAIIDGTLEETILAAKQAGETLDWDRIRAERYIPFFEIIHDRAAPPVMDPATENRVLEHLDRKAAEGAPVQPVGALAPEPLTTAPGAPPVEERAPVAEKSAGGTIGESNEFDRVIGAVSSGYRLAKKALDRVLGFDPEQQATRQRREVAELTEDNPYADMELPNLRELLDRAPRYSEARLQILDAIRAKELTE